MDVQHSGITQKIGGSLGAVPWLLPSETEYYPEKVSEKKPLVGYGWIFHYWGTPYTCMGCLSGFLRRKHILDIVSQKQISCDLSTSFAAAKWRGPLGSWSWKLLELTSVSWFLAYVKAVPYHDPMFVGCYALMWVDRLYCIEILCLRAVACSSESIRLCRIISHICGLLSTCASSTHSPMTVDSCMTFDDLGQYCESDKNNQAILNNLILCWTLHRDLSEPLPEQDWWGQKSEKNLKCDHMVIVIWWTPHSGHKLIFLAKWGWRKDFGVILAIEANYYRQCTYGIYVMYSI